MATGADWESIGEGKRAKVSALLPAKWKISEPVPDACSLPDATEYPRSFLTQSEIEITEAFTAQALVRKIADRTFTAVQVTTAFCRRATMAHQLVNCLSEVMFEEALKRAAELDLYFETHGKPVGPLHGLPISLKDAFRVDGFESSVGYISWLGKRETRDTESEVVKILREAGAVFYVKTNVPTSLMAIETNNNIIGYTWNAHNRNLSSGGSSGGEASLIAMRGSLLGLGTDIGASIRLPAGVSGLYGLKPSEGRLPCKGVANSMEGQNIVSSVIGPIAHSPADLELMVRVLLDTEPWKLDPKVIKLPWRGEEQADIHERAATSGLCFGVMGWDGMVMPHPPIQRAIAGTVEKLKAHGHEVVDWVPPPHSEAFEILFQTFTADGGADIHNTLALSGEPPVPQLAISYGSEPGTLPVSTVSAHWALQRRKVDYQERYLSYWQSTAALTRSGRAVDAVIMPVAPSTSVEPGKGTYFGYTGVGNVLDYTVVTVPAGKVDRVVDGNKERWKAHEPVGDMDRQIWESYNPNVFHGAPIGLQIMGKRLEEEKILAIVGEVGRCLST